MSIPDYRANIPLFRDGNSTPLDSLLHRPRPSASQQFLNQPWIFLARELYTWQPVIPAQPLTNSISVVCVSDTHNAQPKLPNGDILIHAGDLTQSGSLQEIQKTVDWLRSQPHATKIVIAGNHDLILDANYPQKSDANGDAVYWGEIIYLQDSETTITCDNGRHLWIYGSPYSPRHSNWAFQYPRSENVWNEQIPDDINILITHGPPRAHLDLLKMGCVHLSKELWRIRPQLHVFGHVHEDAGTEWLQYNPLQDAYERTVAAGGGAWNLVWTVKGFVHMFFRSPTEAKILLVNSAIVGGLQCPDRYYMRALSKDIHFQKKRALKESLWGTFPVTAGITSVSYNLGPFMTQGSSSSTFSRASRSVSILIGDTSWTIARHAMLNQPIEFQRQVVYKNRKDSVSLRSGCCGIWYRRNQPGVVIEEALELIAQTNGIL